MDAPFWWQGAAVDGVRVAFSSVGAGNLALHVGPAAEEPAGGAARAQVLARRRALEQTMGVGPGRLRFLEQVHSAVVRDAAETAGPPDLVGGDEGAPVGDAWVSSDGSRPLAIMVADCLPVLLVGRREDGAAVTGAAHAGRPGLVAGVLEETAAAMRRRGARRLAAWIGPGACGGCYEVPAEMHAELTARRPALAARTRAGTPALDLRAEAAAILAAQQVEVVDVAGCTIEDETLFSHRRDPGRGRFVGVVWRHEHPEHPGSGLAAPQAP